MQIEAALTAFRKGEFVMDAAQIELEQRAEQKPTSYSGPGYIRQLANGGFELKCYASASPEAGLASFVGGPGPGEIYKDEHHYNCRITDHNGEVWETDPLLIQVSYSFPMEAAAIRVPLLRLVRRVGARTSSWTLRLEFQNQRPGDWYALIGAHQVDLKKRHLSIDLNVTDTDGSIIIVATSDSELPADFQTCLVQALTFVLGEDLSPAVSDYTTPGGRTVWLSAFKQRKPSRPIFPPLDPRQRGKVVRLLQHYLNHILGETLGDDMMWHPLSVYLSQARQVTGNSLDSWAVGLTVAVEGVAKRVRFTPPVSDTDFAALTAKVAGLLDEQGYPDSIRKRVESMLRGMGTVSAKDRMYSLVSSGHVLESDISAWSKSRNSAVHTKHVNLDDLIDDKMQKQMDLLLTVHRLMHSLVFYLIDYAGEFTNYAARDFPTASYPFVDGAPVEAKAL